MLADGADGSISSKRVITFLAFILCSIAFIANLFFGMKIDAFMFETMAYIVMAGLGVTVAEKFSVRNGMQYDQSKHYVDRVGAYPPAVSRTRGTKLPQQEDTLL